MPTPEQERELAALADGSLPEAQRARAEQRAASSALSSSQLAEQRRAVVAVRGVSVAAPPALRARLEAEYGRRARVPRTRRRILTVPAIAATAAAAVTILLFALPSGGPGAPSVVSAAAVAVRPPTAAVPTPNPGSALLGVQAAGVPYPNWLSKYRWRAAGMRTDGIGDRTATTVFYRHGRRSIAYTIVSGAPLAPAAHATTTRREGTWLQTLDLGGRTVVTWTRLGHTCVLSSAHVSPPTLMDLAVWRASGQIPF
jgi:hypothetical protein